MDAAALSVVEALRLMDEGKLSSVEATRACLFRIEKENPRVNAVVTLDAKGALRRAEAADAARARGKPLGPLHGIPFTLKDNWETAGMRTTASHPPLKDNVPDHDATVAERLKSAGAILLGKTNLPELALDFQTDSPLFGRTNNPHDPTRTSGGSSGGAAAAVASGMSFFDIGNDLLGSVRIPAGFCGVTGFVASVGVVPRTGIIPLRPSGESVGQLPRAGILARTVEDAGLIARVVAGQDGTDTHAIRVTDDYWRAGDASEAAQARGRHGLTFLATANAGGVPVCRETRAAFEGLLGSLERAGASVRMLAAGDFDFQAARLAFLRIFYPAAVGASMPPLVRFIARRIGRMSFLDMDLKRYLDAEVARRQAIGRLDALLSGADGLLCPVTSTPAFPHAKPTRMNGPMPVYDGGIDVDGRTVDYGTAVVGFTLPFSATGHPVVTLPIGSSASGLPIGAQVVGRRFGDAALLETAAVIEALVGA